MLRSTLVVNGVLQEVDVVSQFHLLKRSTEVELRQQNAKVLRRVQRKVVLADLADPEESPADQDVGLVNPADLEDDQESLDDQDVGLANPVDQEDDQESPADPDVGLANPVDQDVGLGDDLDSVLGNYH